MDAFLHSNLGLAGMFVAGLVLLVKGAGWFVDGAASLAARFGMSPLVVGLTVVAIGTSAPEMGVSAYAAWQGSGEMALANVMGSNIFNLGFILALCAIIKPVLTDQILVYRDTAVVLLGGILVSLFVWTGATITRLEGSILIALLIGYLFLAWRTSKGLDPESTPEGDESMSPWRIGILLIFGLAALLLGSRLVVESAQTVALQMGISEWMIGISIVAVGTSLPELVTAVASIAKGRSAIGVGGLIGSDIFNFFGVVGIAALIKPMTIAAPSHLPFGFLIGTILLTGWFLRTKWSLSRMEALVLMSIASFRYGMEIFG